MASAAAGDGGVRGRPRPPPTLLSPRPSTPLPRSDPGVTYRSRDEVSGVRTTRDPIALLKKWLLEYKLCTDEEVKAIEKRMRAEVDAAVAFAKDAPQPPANELTADIYSGMKVDPRMCNL